MKTGIAIHRGKILQIRTVDLYSNSKQLQLHSRESKGKKLAHHNTETTG